MSEKFAQRNVEPDPSERILDELMELAAAKEVIQDSAPEDWKESIDESLIVEYRATILKWSNDEILRYCKRNYVWDDPTFAQALVDVIAGRVTPALKT